MMQVFRLAGAAHAHDLTGAGTRLAGGRWNRRGTAVLYTSSSRALAILEVLVHIPVSFIPNDYRMLTIHIPEDSLVSLPIESLPPYWDELTPPADLKSFTDGWLTEGRFLVMKVPSAIVVGEFNYLINPNHPRSKEVSIGQNEIYRFDPRLLH